MDVVNGSFETMPVVGQLNDGDVHDAVPGWRTVGVVGISNPSDKLFLGTDDPDPDLLRELPVDVGRLAAWADDGALVQEMPDTLIAPDYEYELSVDVGRAFDTPPAMNCVELWAGNSRLIGSTSLAPKPGQFLRTKVCFTANSGDSRVGQPLRIRLLSKDGRTYFDRLKLRRMFVADSGLRKETNDWTELGCVRSALTEGQVFVEILRISGARFDVQGVSPRWQPPRYVAWVIPPKDHGDVRMVDLGGAVEIERALLVARQELARGAGSTTDTKDQDAVERARRRLRELGKLLLDPIAGVAGDAKHWIVGPDSALWLVPWGALVTSEGRYALEDRNITYVVSGRDLLSRASTEDKRTTAAIVFGAVDFDAFSEGRCSNSSRAADSEADPFRPLRGTDQEVRLAVAALDRLTKKTPIVLTKEAARESRLKQVERPEYLVLATHGFFRPCDPFVRNPLLNCGLATAGANLRNGDVERFRSEAGRPAAPYLEDDGILTGQEVLGIDLNGTRLVVLSACNTGTGRLTEGEGVAGMRQAFQMAGAEAVVATLWPIPDQETSELMGTFYDALADGKSRAQSLREAQLEFARNKRAESWGVHPFYWAAFTLTGHCD